jgi:hypothetical protein
MISCLLKGDQLTHQVAGYFPRVLVHELRRGRVFNVIPAAPLDGGRLLQAVLWCISKDRLKAPGMASRAGPEGSWLPA